MSPHLCLGPTLQGVGVFGLPPSPYHPGLTQVNPLFPSQLTRLIILIDIQSHFASKTGHVLLRLLPSCCLIICGGEQMRFYDATNRVDDAIVRQQGRIDALVAQGVDLQGNPIAASLEKLNTTMALTPKDHFDFQNLQTRAATLGRINTDEALTITNALGERHNADNGGWELEVDLATKVIVTQIVSELLDKRFKA